MDNPYKLITDAKALEQAGVFSIVLEMVPSQVAKIITNQLNIPTIGIGAGHNVDGQILVTDDLLGKFTDFKPKFVRYYSTLADIMQEAINNYANDVKTAKFPLANESFHLDEMDEMQLESLIGSKN